MKTSEHTPVVRPRPVPNAESWPFWLGAQEGRIVLPQCVRCGRVTGPMASHCPDCLSSDLQPMRCSGDATLKGRTVLHAPAYEGQPVPSALVECAVAEEPRVVLVATDCLNITINLPPDAPIRIIFSEEDGHGYLARVGLRGDS